MVTTISTLAQHAVAPINHAQLAVTATRWLDVSLAKAATKSALTAVASSVTSAAFSV